ncbi:uncharacterized protein [Clytia hemisphaerica]|uniref:DUF389 domain containing protein n=1 Tax=Clytia hemisphaerica TaxID=252671 RepID=A0A7M5WRF8_9CNID
MSSSVLFIVTLPFEEDEEEPIKEEADTPVDAAVVPDAPLLNEDSEVTEQSAGSQNNADSEEKITPDGDLSDEKSSDSKVTSSTEVQVEIIQEESKPSKVKKQKSVYKYKRRFEAIIKNLELKIDATWIKNTINDSWKILFELDGDKIDALLNALLNAGIGNNEYSSVSIIPINIHFPTAVEKEEDKKIDDMQQFRQTVKSRMNVAQVVTSVKNGSQMTFDYIMLLILASMIAAIGLLENSSVLLVASMLVSPLMGPILGGTFGLVLQSKQVWKPAVFNELIGLSLCLIVGFFIGLLTYLTGISENVTTEMQSRGEPRGLLVGLLVAIPSGAAVALSFLQGNFGSLIGVAISASLLPPAVNAGMFWAFAVVNSAKDVAPISSSQQITHFSPDHLGRLGAISVTLTLVNIVVIFIMGVVVLKIKEVAPKTATAITSSFWKKDLKETRQMLHKHEGGENAIEESLIQDYSKLRNIDLKNKETIQGAKGQKVAKELSYLIKGIEQDNEYTAVTNRLVNKPGSGLNHMKKVLGFNTGSSRFQVEPVSTIELVPREYSYVNRFKTTRYDEIDHSKKSDTNTKEPLGGKKSVVSLNLPADFNQDSSNKTIRKSPSMPRVPQVAFSDVKAADDDSPMDGESENAKLIPPV